MHARVLLLTLGVAVAIVGTAVAGQHEGHQVGAASPSAAQVGECRQAQPVVTELLNAALKRLEEARLTNSAAAMRDAADDVQAALVDMRTQLAPCGVMQPAATDQAAASTTPLAPAPAAPAAMPGAADPHTGHVMPGAPQAPAARGRPAAPTQRPAAPAAVDSHAAHAMPAAPNRRPSAPPPAAAIGDDAHAGHAAAAASAKEATPSVAGSPSAPAPPTSIADLKCPNSVDARTAPRILYQGRMYYFCTEASRSEFAKEPGKFVTAPPQAAPVHAH